MILKYILKALRQNAIRDQQDILGDHNLNPGMSIPEVSKPAAVLIPVIGRDQEPTILLTRRSDDLNHHAGQVSFLEEDMKNQIQI